MLNMQPTDAILSYLKITSLTYHWVVDVHKLNYDCNLLWQKWKHNFLDYLICQSINIFWYLKFLSIWIILILVIIFKNRYSKALCTLPEDIRELFFAKSCFVFQNLWNIYKLNFPFPKPIIKFHSSIENNSVNSF